MSHVCVFHHRKKVEKKSKKKSLLRNLETSQSALTFLAFLAKNNYGLTEFDALTISYCIILQDLHTETCGPNVTLRELSLSHIDSSYSTEIKTCKVNLLK
jgi:hypothetical protein